MFGLLLRRGLYFTSMFLLQYKNIWRDVEIEVNYDLVQQSSGGPILEKFNARNPGASLQNVLRKTVRARIY